MANPLESILFPSFPMALDISSYKFISSCPTGFLISSMLFYGEGNGTSLQYSCLENPMDGGAWKAAVHGVAKSQTRLSDLAAAAAEIVKGKRSFEIAHPIKT